MAQLYVGIDLGTTNSTVSVIQTEDRRLRNPIDHLRSIPILQYDKDFNLKSLHYSSESKERIYLSNKRNYETL